MPTNDNDPHPSKPAPLPDPHGQAALLLVESLIHGLRERSVLDVAVALDIVETALEVQDEVAQTADGAGAPMQRARALLSAIAESLRQDGGDEPKPRHPV